MRFTLKEDKNIPIIVAADGLATQGARSSAAMILGSLSRKIGKHNVHFWSRLESDLIIDEPVNLALSPMSCPLGPIRKFMPRSREPDGRQVRLLHSPSLAAVKV